MNTLTIQIPDTIENVLNKFISEGYFKSNLFVRSFRSPGSSRLLGPGDQDERLAKVALLGEDRQDAL